MALPSEPGADDCEQREEIGTLAVAREDLLPSVAAGGDVEDAAGDLDSGRSGHEVEGTRGDRAAEGSRGLRHGLVTVSGVRPWDSGGFGHR